MPNLSTHRFGRIATPPELARSVRLKVSFRPSEIADLEAIAEAWDVPVGAAAWAIVSDVLAEIRGLWESGDRPSQLALLAARSMRLARESRAILAGDEGDHAAP